MSFPATWDKNGVKYRQILENPGQENWLFLPGGPGADSWYMHDLAVTLNMPGKSWLLDLPGNGGNSTILNKQPYPPFCDWPTILFDAISQFDNVNLVCHSFGAMLALTLPELENRLERLIILNSAPVISIRCSLKKIASLSYRSLKNIAPDFHSISSMLKAIKEFYCSSLIKMTKLNQGRPFNFYAASWWLNKLIFKHFQATWIPQSVPTLIICAASDFITPSVLFKQDARYFYNRNIKLVEISGASHFIWHEKPQEVKDCIREFYKFGIR